MKKLILVVTVTMLLVGCGESPRTIVEESTEFSNRKQDILASIADVCGREDAVVCKNNPITTHPPDLIEVTLRTREMLENLVYVTDNEQYNTIDYWHDGVSTSVELVGDCEDAAMTLLHQLITDGVSSETLGLLLTKSEDSTVFHMSVVVLIDGEEYGFLASDETPIDILIIYMDNVTEVIDLT